ncbi:TPM domain-containing protein [Peribacillus sp. NJ11]|uniref:TPM domain-containing protein n=1 Tax=Peribacillus sp. NJ11 TaxID=3055861 RepID=UPI0025A1F93D|nr:TPM domain-containing protein [Peribacillus sp. NJ11]MDM5221876.1 TPM domain-containing protein [Peribacillus sp. NJ11]
MKRLAVFALFFILTCSLANVVAAQPNIPEPVGDIYVQDFAGVLDDQEKSELIELGKRLDDATKAQISVLTVDSMEGSEIEEYSVEALRSFKLGDAEQNNGVLIVLAMEEQKIRIEVGYGLEGAITDIKSGQILDNVAIPALKEGKYDVALTETYKAVYKDVTKEYNLGDEFYQDLSVQPESENFQPSGLQIFLIIIVVIIVFILDAKFFKGFFLQMLINILLIIISRGGGGGRGGGSGGPRGGGGGSSGGGGASRGW